MVHLRGRSVPRDGRRHLRLQFPGPSHRSREGVPFRSGPGRRVQGYEPVAPGINSAVRFNDSASGTARIAPAGPSTQLQNTTAKTRVVNERSSPFTKKRGLMTLSPIRLTTHHPRITTTRSEEHTSE